MNSNYKFSVKAGIHTLEGGKGGGRGRSGKLISRIDMKLLEPSPLSFKIDEACLDETAQKMKLIFEAEPERLFRRSDLEEIVQKSKPTVCRALVVLQETKIIEKVQRDHVPYYRKESKDGSL